MKKQKKIRPSKKNRKVRTGNHSTTAVAPPMAGAQPHQKDLDGLLDLYNSGKLGETERRARQLIDAFPKAFFPWNILGVVLSNQKNFEEAVVCYQRALKLNPDSAMINGNLGAAFLEIGDFDNAVVSCRKALEISPQNAELHVKLGNAYLGLGKREAAIASYRRALKINPDFAKAHNNLGSVLRDLGMLEEALASYRKAISLEPMDAVAHNNLLESLEKSNRTEALREAVDHAKKFCAGEPRIVLSEALLLRGEGDYITAREVLENVDVSAANALFSATRAFILGDLCDRLGETDAAYSYFSEGNRFCRTIPEVTRFDGGRYLSRIDILARRFSVSWIAEWQSVEISDDRPDPVFLIGFPRSGTTLLDTILRGHAGIAVIEESAAVGKMRTVLARLPGGHPDGLAKLDSNQIAKLRQAYFTELDNQLKSEDKPALVIDKLPLNITEVGFIHRVFPQARFVFAQRHPCDCVLSCFMQNFAPNDAMVNFYDLGDATQTYDNVMTLWQQYQDVLPLQVHTVRYENLVEAFEETLTPLLDFLGVGWDDGVRDYAETARQRGRINTPSYNQVTQPLYTRARGRWEQYRDHLQPVLPILLPWAERFGYGE